MNKHCGQSLYNMLTDNQFLDTLIISGVSLGNHGMKWMVKAFDHGLEKVIMKEKEIKNKMVGAYIPSGKYRIDEEKDYSILPKLKDEEVIEQNAAQSAVNLKHLYI